jgi:putative glutamine amidotransferase
MAPVDLLMDSITLGKPIIGVTCDFESPKQQPSDYAKYPWYVLRTNYCDAIAHAGGIPIVLPYHIDMIQDYVDLVDGIVITGGGFDIDPKLFGATTCHPSVKLKPERTHFEWALMKAAYQKGKSILGICGGMQLMNVIFGGTLIQHIPDDVPDALNHASEADGTSSTHSIQFIPQTLLDRISGPNKENIVNSTHHQAVDKIADRFKVSAIASDHIIEAIESSDHPFCLGVQWHPEYETCDIDKGIFKAFIKSMSR